MACGVSWRRSFTLVEIIIVVILISMVAMLLLPRIGYLPRSVVEKRVISEIRSAFYDAGMRARATGKTVKLILDLEEAEFVIEDDEGAEGLSVVSLPATDSVNSTIEDNLQRESIVKLRKYKISDEVSWELGELDLGEDEKIFFLFYPNGEVSGNELKFMFRKVLYIVSVDSLTGRVSIAEVEE